MIGMDMGFQQPLHCGALRFHIGDELVGGGGLGAARRGVEIEHRIDDRRLPGGRVDDDIAHGEGIGVEEAFHVRAGGGHCGGSWGSHGRLLLDVAFVVSVFSTESVLNHSGLSGT
jgi:hypothetical protein